MRKKCECTDTNPFHCSAGHPDYQDLPCGCDCHYKKVKGKK